MSRLRVFADQDAAQARLETTDFVTIRDTLASVGVGFERWQAAAPIQPGAPAEQVIAAYRADIDRLIASDGYQSVDVISLAPDHPDRAMLREKFLNEHTHAEDEVRFFVAGSGLFDLHIQDQVYELLCMAGDLIRVPAGTRHWFDMGPEPSFVAIRLFNNPAGWVANFTGDGIAGSFPRHEPLVAAQ